MRWKLEDTPEESAFRAEFLGWLKEHLPQGWMEAIDAGDEEAFDRVRGEWNMYEWNRTFGESGYGAPLWPKEFGGLSGEIWHQQISREELARYRLPIVGFNILGIGLAGPTLIEHGTEEQKQRYLRKMLTGEEVWCQLFSEPGSGSDLASVATRADKNGDDWTLNGQKVWTSLAQFAAFGMILARSDPEKPKHDGLSYFIVDMKAPGVEIRPLRQITGASEFNEVYFTDVKVPDSSRVGAVGDGWKVARTTLMNERVALSGVGLSTEAFTGGRRKDPWQAFVEGTGGRDRPLVRQEMARVFARSEAKEITGFRAALARRRGQPGAEGGIAKVFVAELNQYRTNFSMNAAGPAAIAWVPGDQAAEARAHAFVRTRANTIEGGTSEVLRNQMAERILGLPRDFEADKGIPWKDIRRS